MGGRRVVLVRMSGELLAGMCVGVHGPGEWVRRTQGLPDGAKCVGMDIDIVRDELVLKFEHESFGEVPAGCHISNIGFKSEPQYTTLSGSWLVGELAAGRLTVAKLAETLHCADAMVLPLVPETTGGNIVWHDPGSWVAQEVAKGLGVSEIDTRHFERVGDVEGWSESVIALPKTASPPLPQPRMWGVVTRADGSRFVVRYHTVDDALQHNPPPGGRVELYGSEDAAHVAAFGSAGAAETADTPHVAGG